MILISPQAVPLTNRILPKEKHKALSIRTFSRTEHNRPAHFHGSACGTSWSQPWELTRLEVVVDDGRVNLVEVLESVDNLHDDGAALLLGHQLILLQVEIQIVAFTVLQHSAEAAKCESG